MTKKCARCGEIKLLEKFNNSSKAKDGKQSWCKDCSNARNREEYLSRVSRICEVTLCGRKVVGLTFCRGHLARFRRYGSPLLGDPIKRGLGYLDKKGYRIMYKPTHPYANAEGRIREHVMVMSDYLGRALFSHENVHHINGVRDDNRIENLELWSTSQPSSQRVEDKLSWAYEIIKIYGPDTRKPKRI